MKPSSLATISQSHLERFRQIDAQFKSVTQQRLQLQDIEARLIMLKENLWREVIKIYNLPPLEELQKDNFDLQVNFETGKIDVCEKL